MDGTELRAIQAPLKERYRAEPEAALVTLTAQGTLDAQNVSCSVATGRALVEAGLHPATGGSGMLACSGDMLLEALVACAGVTLASVATALGIDVRGASEPRATWISAAPSGLAGTSTYRSASARCGSRSRSSTTRPTSSSRS